MLIVECLLLTSSLVNFAVPPPGGCQSSSFNGYQWIREEAEQAGQGQGADFQHLVPVWGGTFMTR